jgi:hypothetical protein
VVQQMHMNSVPQDGDLDENLVEGSEKDEAAFSDPIQGRLSQ